MLLKYKSSSLRFKKRLAVSRNVLKVMQSRHIGEILFNISKTRKNQVHMDSISYLSDK